MERRRVGKCDEHGHTSTAMTPSALRPTERQQRVCAIPNHPPKILFVNSCGILLAIRGVPEQRMPRRTLRNFILVINFTYNEYNIQF